LEHLDVRFEDKVVQCHQVDHSDHGLLGGMRGTVYGELGLGAPGPVRLGPEAAPLKSVVFEDGDDDMVGGARELVTVAVIRDALRSLHQPLELAASPLARGPSTEQRAASVRAEVQDAVANAFGDSPDEQLLRRIVQRGYLDPAGSHELAADELHVSRATYFRRLRSASQRVADYLIAKHA
jgi:hypothetical protein